MRDSVIVLANPGDGDVHETVLTGNSKLMHPFRLLDQLPTQAAPVSILAGLIEVSVPARSVRVLVPEMEMGGGYSSYKRVR